jgi:transcriptional regulator with XRE-family HTH domain
MRANITEIGKRIRQIRGKLSLVEFEKAVGISKAAISVYERGQGSPRIDMLTKIAEYGEVTIEWLVTGKEPSTLIVHEHGETYLPDGKTDEEIMHDHLERVIEGLEKQGVERVIAEKMLEATIREMRITGSGPDGYINLGDFLKDAKRRLEKEAAHQEQAAEGDK